MLAHLIQFCIRNRFLVIVVFCALAAFGAWSLPRQSFDALPDTADTQVIVVAHWDQFPDRVESQVSYPLMTAFMGAPRVRTVRAFTSNGLAMLYIVFQDGTDGQWARARVTEELAKASATLPVGALAELGPDASGVGWIFQYALVEDAHRYSPAELRSFQDWTLRYALQSVPGVAEVASVGGFESELQVLIDPHLLAERHVPLKQVLAAVRESNRDVSGGVLVASGRELIVRARGSIASASDLERIPVMTPQLPRTEMRGGEGTLFLRDVATVEPAPKPREGVTDLNGRGEAVGGIVIMRHDENALSVIQRVKERLRSLEPSLPPGVRVEVTYDRSGLIQRSLDSLKSEILLAILVVSAVILLALGNIRSALIALVTIPATLLISCGLFYLLHIGLNAMSLAGIVLSVGVLVDGAIVLVENASRSLTQTDADTNPSGSTLRAIREVAPAVFLSMLLIAISFLPVFALTGEEGRLFRPLAAAKTIVVFVAAILTITLVPLLQMLAVRSSASRWRPIRIPTSLYEKVLRWTLANPWITVIVVIALGIGTVPIFLQLGSEFIPPLDEESLLYMPTTLPGISSIQALRLIQHQDALLAAAPEIGGVYGKAGRAETATDPAPLSMVETTIQLRPRDRWRERKRWYSDWSPEWLKALLWRRFASDRISQQDLIADLDARLKLPGVVNSWTMPIRGRTGMLNTGARTSVAVKVLGPTLAATERTAIQVESLLRTIPETRSAFAERADQVGYLDIDLNRDQLADFGLSVNDAADVVSTAIAGTPATELIKGRARTTVVVRYPAEFRSDIESIGGIGVQTDDGEIVPLRSVANIHIGMGPGMIRSEQGQMVTYVYVDAQPKDLGRYVALARQTLQNRLKPEPGCFLVWTGEYENLLNARSRLQLVVPATVLLVAILLFANTRSWAKTLLVLLAIPFSAIGAFWFLYLLRYKISVATWIGIVALIGLDAETAVLMLLFLDLSFDAALRNNRLLTATQWNDAIVDGAAHRIRPKLMTVLAVFVGLLPTMLSAGTGSDFTRRIVAPMTGGLLTSFLLELFVIPVLYLLWQKHSYANSHVNLPGNQKTKNSH